MSKTFLISGAGIAGLTAALALAESGKSVEVFEKAEGFETVGAGIQLSPNAFKILAALKLERQLKSIATAPHFIDIHSGYTGALIKQIPLVPDTQLKYKAPYLVIHRADLHQILAAACNAHAGINIRMSSEVIDAIPHKNGVTVLVQSSEGIREHVGQALIVADGIWSKIRTETLGLTRATDTGLIAWRGMIAINRQQEFGMDNTSLWLSPKSHAVCYPVRNGRYLNVVGIVNNDQQAGPREEMGTAQSELLREVFSDWHDDFTQMFNASARWTRWPLFINKKLQPVAFKSIVLIGDAAHAMLPFAAQGAAMAIEDAAVLAQQINQHGDVDDAFLKYEKLRRGRVKRVMRLSERNREIYHLRAPFSVGRNLVMNMIPGSRLLAMQDWLYGWEV